MKKQFAAAAAALALFSTAHADGVRPVVGAHLTFGGENLAEMQYTDGTSQKIRSGGLVHLFGGAEIEMGAFALQGNIGYHVDNTTARNGSIRFSRWPVELIALWQVDPAIRLGVGARKAASTQISGSGVASNLGSHSFGSKAGLILQGEYVFAKNWSGILRFVREDYTVGGTTVSGNHGGLGFAYRF